MISRRTLTKSGAGSLLTLVSASQLHIAAQTPMAEELQYQGFMAFQHLPELPTAPEGAIVLKGFRKGTTAAVVYHNATNDTVAVTKMTADSPHFEEDKSFNAPQILQPGEYGIACPEFELIMKPIDDVPISITVVPESEADPTLVEVPIMKVELEPRDEGSQVNLRFINRTEHTLAPGYAELMVFFSPGRELLDWFSKISLGDMTPGEETHSQYGSNSLQTSDSFMAVVVGRIQE